MALKLKTKSSGNAMKLNPYSLNAKVKHERLHTYRIDVGNGIMNIVKEVIEKIKPINRLDPEFCYTCLCDGLHTSWILAYSSPKLCVEAARIVATMFEESEARGLCQNRKAAPSLPDFTNACVCPFSMK